MSFSPFDLDLAALPKVSLHDHLDGGLRPATVVELAREVGHQLPADNAEELAEWFSAAAYSGALEKYLETFDHTLAVMQTAHGLTRVAREFVEDLVEDGVIYAEVRWAPEQHTTQGLSLDEAIDAVQAGLNEGAQEAENEGYLVRTGQLITAMRQNDNAQEVAEAAVRHRDSGVVGFDIAGPESGFPPARFADTFTWLAQQNFPATVHAGEAEGLDSIQDALVSGRALRLGHGVRLAEDMSQSRGEGNTQLVKFGQLANWVRNQEIPLELCPTSNLQTGAVALPDREDASPLADHPFDMLHQLGFAVTVSPDNRLISGVSLTDELYQLADTFGYTLEDLLQFQLNAARAAFIDTEDREAIAERLVEAWSAAMAGDDDTDGPAVLSTLEDDDNQEEDRDN